MSVSLSTILKDSEYTLSQFEGSAYVSELEEKITVKTDKNGKQTYYVPCIIRDKEIKLTPEEIVRQLYTYQLLNKYGYKKEDIVYEYPVHFGRDVKRADIVILDKNDKNAAYIIVETKKPKEKDGKEQLKSYCNGTGAALAVWTNGKSLVCYNRKDPNYFEEIPDIPAYSQKLSDILNDKWFIDDLKKKDVLVKDRRSLKDLILNMEDEVLANAGVDVFEEVFKLLLTKLYDEFKSGRDKSRPLEFRNNCGSDSELKEKIQKLFDAAQSQWEGIFKENTKIDLSPSHLAVCVGSLEKVKLFNSNFEVVDDAFEYLINKSSKGEKGQYFTPRYVIDMCVKMLNPSEDENMIDTAAGSCGFPVHTIFHVWRKILQKRGLETSELFSLEEKPADCNDYVQKHVFAIDFDERAVRVARTLNLIAGDGHTNVLHLNTLDWKQWQFRTDDETWQDTYGEGWKKLRKLRREEKQNREFNFDIVMANPPFAGDIKEGQLLQNYELAKKENGKFADKMGRDILFIERNLDFLKPGGRMAVVLPQGRFNNSSDKYIRDYIAERCRILAVVGLHGNTFKPHTGTKTSVLFVQKWDEKLCPKKDDYNIFFATMQKSGKDNSGDKIYVKENVVSYFEEGKLVQCEESKFLEKYKSYEEYERWVNKNDINDVLDGLAYRNCLSEEEQKNYIKQQSAVVETKYKLDHHGHLIVDHDLFNHDGLTQDGIAEAFAEFAKKEGLSFF